MNSETPFIKLFKVSPKLIKMRDI